MKTQKLPEGGEPIRVVGTSSYQDAIWRIVGAPTTGHDSRAYWHGEAALEPEPENCHDCNAVKVTIDGQTVGYLDRELAARLQPDLLSLRDHGVELAAACFARGGFELREGGRASVGLALAFDPRDVHRAAGAFAVR